MIGWWWLACRHDEPAQVSGGCEVDEADPLRARCTFDAQPPGPIELTIGDGSGEEVVRSGASGEELLVWRLRGDTDYDVVASSGGGEARTTFRTGAVPRYADLQVSHDGEPLPDDVMFVTDCEDGPAAVVVAPDGAVVWAQPLAGGLPGGEHFAVGLSTSGDGTILAVVDGHVREFDAAGSLVAEWTPDDPAHSAHHDVFRRGERTYALRARREVVDGVEVMIDGVVAFDAAGQVFDWDLASLAEPTNGGALGDLYWLTRYPDAVDWAHANGIWVYDDGDFLISLHTFSTLLRIEGDPDDPAFGTPVWTLSAVEGGPFVADRGVVDPDGLTADDTFEHQHHPSFQPDGSFTVFDNGETLSSPARALALSLDDDEGEVRITGSWPLVSRAGEARVCPIEGGVFALSTGDWVASCAVAGTYDAIDHDSGATLSSTHATCRSPGGLQLLPRPIPVRLDDGLRAISDPPR